MNEIILAIIVIASLIIILIFLFALTIKRVNILVKQIFVDKLQTYDFLIEDREKRIEELKTNIELKEKKEKELDALITKLEEEIKEKEIKTEEVIIPTNADFEDGNILEEYKKIKEGFDFDNEKIILDFIEKELKEDTTEIYDTLIKIRKNFSHKVIYKISNYNKEEQKIIINELLEKKEKEILKDLLNVNKFNIVKFINKLDDLITSNNPKAYIYVSNKKDNYDKYHKLIKTIYDEKMVEGFRIEYKGKIYDYSL